MGEPTELIKRRATANALWTPLRHALLGDWPIVTDWTNHDPRGNPHTSDYAPSGIPGPLPTYTPTNETGRVLGRLEPRDWPGNGLILTARLWQDHYQQAHERLTPHAHTDWTRAWQTSNARTPFLQETNRHGTPTLRRNHDPQALITPLVADFLETLANLATVTLLTPEREAMIEAALFTDDDELPADLMRPNELLAALARSGIEEPE